MSDNSATWEKKKREKAGRERNPRSEGRANTGGIISRQCEKPDGIRKTACSISHGRIRDDDPFLGERFSAKLLCQLILSRESKIRDNGAST